MCSWDAPCGFVYENKRDHIDVKSLKVDEWEGKHA